MVEVLILAIALSMDAFAVSIGIGIKQTNITLNQKIKVAFLFGFFQGIMPLIGYLANLGAKDIIEAYDHWIAFILLAFIGSKMVYESFSENIEDEIISMSNKVLLTLAIATSIDAMAAGFSLELFSINPFITMFIIAITTFGFSYLGIKVGQNGGAWFESKAELLGGIVLILIGLKILIEHTFS